VERARLVPLGAFGRVRRHARRHVVRLVAPPRRRTHSFELVLAYVSLAGLVGALSYTVVIGRIHRIEI